MLVQQALSYMAGLIMPVSAPVVARELALRLLAAQVRELGHEYVALAAREARHHHLVEQHEPGDERDRADEQRRERGLDRGRELRQSSVARTRRAANAPSVP